MGSNPFETYVHQIGSSPHVRSKNKTCLKPPPSSLKNPFHSNFPLLPRQDSNTMRIPWRPCLSATSMALKDCRGVYPGVPRTSKWSNFTNSGWGKPKDSSFWKHPPTFPATFKGCRSWSCAGAHVKCRFVGKYANAITHIKYTDFIYRYDHICIHI